MDIASEGKTGVRHNIKVLRLVFVGFGLSGAAALIYEVVWTRCLSTIMGSSTYAVSTMLAAFMTGLSIGGWLGAVLAPRLKRLGLAFALCEMGIGVAGLVTIPVIMALTPLYMKTFYSFHLSFSSFSVVQFVIIFLIMGVPTTLMGMTFPFVVKLFSAEGQDVGRQAGLLYGINTFGAIIGSTVAGFLLIPRIGVNGTAVVAASLNIFTALVILILSRDVKKIIAVVTVLLVLVPFSSLTATPFFPFFSYYNACLFGDYEMAYDVYKRISDQANSKVIYHNEGVDGDVALIEYSLHQPDTMLALTNNGKREFGDDKGFALLAYLPFFSHGGGGAEKVLNIGLGSGNTLAHLSRFPVQHIDSVELSEGILDVNRRFLKPDLFDDPRINHVRADGRNYLLMSPGKYDLIVASPSWAVESASAGLLTDEFFSLASQRLADDGVMAVWVDFFLMTHDDLEIVARTFSRNFKHAVAWYVEGDFIILVGSPTPFKLAPQALVQNIGTAFPYLQDKFSVAMAEEQINALLPGEINTDDRPIIEFRNAQHIINWRSEDEEKM